MARLDRFIQSVFHSGADRLVMASGEKAVICTGDEQRPVSAPPAA